MGNRLGKSESMKSTKRKYRGFLFRKLKIAIPEVQDNEESGEIFNTSLTISCNPVELGTCSEQGLIICHPTDDDITRLKVPCIEELPETDERSFLENVSRNQSDDIDIQSICDGSKQEIVTVINKDSFQNNVSDTLKSSICLPKFEKLLPHSSSDFDSNKDYNHTREDSYGFIINQELEECNSLEGSSQIQGNGCDEIFNDQAEGYESCITSPEENHNDADDGYVRQVILRKHQSPQYIQNFLNDFSQHRKFAVVNADLSGGSYFLKDIDTFLYLQPSSVPTNLMKELLIVKSANEEDFPQLVNSTDLISDVFHFYPHKQRFKHRVLVKIPITTDKAEITILYSHTDYSSVPNWKSLDCSSIEDDANSKPLYFSKNGYCYLFLKHFCLFCVVKSDFKCNVITKAVNPALTSIPLLVSMYANYRCETDILTVTVTFQTKEDTPPIPKTHTKLGQLIDQDSFCFTTNEGVLKCTIQDPGPGWKLEVQKEPIKNNLFRIDNLQTCPVAKFQFKYYYCNMDSRKSDIKIEVNICEQNELVGTLSEAAVPLTELIPEKSNMQAYETPIKQQRVSVKTNDDDDIALTDQITLLPNQNTAICYWKNLRNTGAIPKEPTATFEPQALQLAQIDSKKNKNWTISIEEVMPYINEKYDKKKDELAFIKNKICHILDKDPKDWQEFGRKIGHGTIAEFLLTNCIGGSPTKILLELWQNDNQAYDNSSCGWPDLVDKLFSVNGKAGEELREWIINNWERETLVGESDNSSETPLLGHPPLLNSS